jgi:hypothetical protein
VNPIKANGRKFILVRYGKRRRPAFLGGFAERCLTGRYLYQFDLMLSWIGKIGFEDGREAWQVIE